jgi:hypothetical protein
MRCFSAVQIIAFISPSAKILKAASLLGSYFESETKTVHAHTEISRKQRMILVQKSVIHRWHEVVLYTQIQVVYALST